MTGSVERVTVETADGQLPPAWAVVVYVTDADREGPLAAALAEAIGTEVLDAIEQAEGDP